MTRPDTTDRAGPAAGNTHPRGAAPAAPPAAGSPASGSPATRPGNGTDRLAPKADGRSPFWQNAHSYFDRVYQTMNLDPMWRAALSSPKRVLTVSCPVKMDDGRIQVFTGYRCQ